MGKVAASSDGDTVAPGSVDDRSALIWDAVTSGDREHLNELARHLQADVRRIAEEVTRGWSGWERQDFIDGALSAIFAPRPRSPARIARYDPAKGDVNGWLARTLRNVWLSQLRCRPPPSVAILDEHGGPADWRLDFENNHRSLGIPFGPADLARIRGWPARERVELLCISGAFPKTPERDWEQFLSNYEQQTQIQLVRPFPPDSVLVCDEGGERIGPLAVALGVRPNTLSQRWGRGKWRLAELEAVQELKGDRTNCP